MCVTSSPVVATYIPPSKTLLVCCFCLDQYPKQVETWRNMLIRKCKLIRHRTTQIVYCSLEHIRGDTRPKNAVQDNCSVELRYPSWYTTAHERTLSRLSQHMAVKYVFTPSVSQTDPSEGPFLLECIDCLQARLQLAVAKRENTKDITFRT